MASSGELPEIYSSYCSNAELAEEFDLSTDIGESCFFAITRASRPWPQLVVAQRYEPAGYGFHPGILIVPETSAVFIGAGTRLLAYEMNPRPRRLWQDTTDVGFWSWDLHEGIVVMSAELEVAAWTQDGKKLWSTFVEPPWQYAVAGGWITLDVMGTERSFSLAEGPRKAR
jgi:hypothetical protein